VTHIFVPFLGPFGSNNYFPCQQHYAAKKKSRGVSDLRGIAGGRGRGYPRRLMLMNVSRCLGDDGFSAKRVYKRGTVTAYKRLTTPTANNQRTLRRIAIILSRLPRQAMSRSSL